MGVVYKAEDTRLKRLVALKFLPIELSQDPEAKDRLSREAQALSALDHPNICTIHEIDETSDRRLFLVMAYYDGETLKKRMARGPLPIDEALAVITQVAQAVATAHEAAIVHRDLKPGNIILTPRGDVKLLDFGLAKLADQIALTRTGTTLGTVAYMAPEQVAGFDADERSDVWALGVMLYEMLAGRLPFRGDREGAVLHAIANDEPTPLRNFRSDLPDDVESVVAKALQKDPAGRFASARAFLDAVETLRLAQTKTIPIETVGTLRMRMTSLRIVVPAAIVLLALVAGVLWSMYRNAEERRARTQALPELAKLVDTEQFAAAFPDTAVSPDAFVE
jgi:serine/threonine protein kinase